MNISLLKNYQYGFALFLIAGFVAYISRPAPPPPQIIGTVENIRESVYFQQRVGGPMGGAGPRRVSITVFTINGVEYIITRNDAYRGLLNKEVTFRYITTNAEHSVSNRLTEIIYDGKLVTPPRKDSNLVFIPAFVLFILGLFWCGRVLVLMWQEWKDYNKS